MFKKILIAVAALLGVAVVALAWSLTPAVLPVGAAPSGLTLPPPPSTKASIAVVETGQSEALAVLAYRGGNFEKRVFGMDVMVVRHPRGTLLVDAGIGTQLEEHLKTAYRRLRALSSFSRAPVSLVDQLKAGGVELNQLRGVYLTHAHFDHVSGLPDLPGVPVFVNRTEREFIANGGDHSALIRSFGALNYQIYDFQGPAYAGFPASHDVFGDGSVVIVPAGAHTPGSIVMFVRTAERDYALIGDLAWQREGVELPAEKPWVSSDMVDHNAEQVRANLVLLHHLQKANPKLLIVPAHDRRVSATLPRLTR